MDTTDGLADTRYTISNQAITKHHLSVPRHTCLIQTKRIAGAYTLVHLVLALRLHPRPLLFYFKSSVCWSKKKKPTRPRLVGLVLCEGEAKAGLVSDAAGQVGGGVGANQNLGTALRTSAALGRASLKRLWAAALILWCD